MGCKCVQQLNTEPLPFEDRALTETRPVTHPWRTEGEWLRCALHAHTTNSDGELAPRMLVKHYERAGYDVLAITDHWHRTEAPSGRALVVPGAELNCLLPGDCDGHVLALGIEADPAGLDERRDLAGRPTGSSPAAVSPTSRIHTGRASRRGRSSCRRPSPGSRSSMPAASSRWGGDSRWCTGTRSSDRPPLLRAGNRRHPSSRLRLRSRVDVVPRCAHGSGACSTRSAPVLLREHSVR